MTVRSLVGTAHGIAAVARRRSSYVGQWLGSSAWPKVAYRFGWGPSAPPLLQGVFAAAGEFAASRTDPGELQRLGLAAPDGVAVPLGNIAPAEVERLMDRAHAAGITGVHHSFRDLVRGPGGALAFGDLTKARRHRPQSIHFLSSRNVDRQAFNQVFGTSIPIERPVGRPRNGMLRPVHQPRTSGTSAAGTVQPAAGAPRDLGPDAWSLFLDQIVAPLVAGKRVLALGSTGSSIPLSLLQAGAREVVAVEEKHSADETTGLTTLAISWRDVQPYDTQVLAGDLRGALTLGLGRFDVITAFRALQYLPEDQLRDVVSRAAGMSTVLIFQACDVIDTLPATTLNLHRLMRHHGYEVQVHTLAGQDGPLLVGAPQSIAIGR